MNRKTKGVGMLIFKTKWFHKWAAREGISDRILENAITEMNQGLIDANLGGNVYKKRIGLSGRGKSSSIRTLLAFEEGERAFFIYGFAKNERDNINEQELKALKVYARELLGYSNVALEKAIKTKILIKVNSNEP
jgi:hypothetical protein